MAAQKQFKNVREIYNLVYKYETSKVCPIRVTGIIICNVKINALPVNTGFFKQYAKFFFQKYGKSLEKSNFEVSD